MYRLKERVKVIGGSPEYIGQEAEVVYVYGDNELYLVRLDNGHQILRVPRELEAVPDMNEVERIADAIYTEKRKDDPMTKEQAMEFATGLYKAGVRHNG